MTSPIRIVQFFNLQSASGFRYLYQNFFVGATSRVPGESYNYAFAPFQVQGGVSNLNGDNIQIQVLFPTTEYALRLVEAADGNRKSRLILNTRTVSERGTVNKAGPMEVFIGLGASFSEDTIELRFNTAADSVATGFPALRLNQKNAGFLPLDSSLTLR